jgi:hypothetical protein
MLAGHVQAAAPVPPRRTEDSSWDVLDSVFVTIAKGAPAGEARMVVHCP